MFSHGQLITINTIIMKTLIKLTFAVTFFSIFQLCQMRAETDSLLIHPLDQFAFETPGPLTTYSSYGVQIDKKGRPFIYSACAQLGLIIFEISPSDQLIAVDTFVGSIFSGLLPMNLLQYEDYLLLSLGNFFSNQTAGLAIIDIADPHHAELLSFWSDPEFANGSTVVVTDGDYAYMGAMEEGLLIFDISDKTAIEFIGRFMPDPDFPEPPTGLSQPKARGLHLEGDLIYLCNDAKGFRIIDVSDKNNPVEISKHMNTDLHSSARPAYNEVVVKDGIAYITVDYCGLEVVDVSDPYNPISLKWLNLWDCNNQIWGTPGSWWDAYGHSNQITLSESGHLFMSGGETEVVVFNLSDPADPKIVGVFGEQDHSVAWGLDVYENQIVTANVHQGLASPPMPYFSNWGGIRLLNWEEPTSVNNRNNSEHFSITVFPNPVKKGESIRVELNENLDGTLKVFNLYGQKVLTKNLDSSKIFSISTDNLLPGFYILHINGENLRFSDTFVVQRN